MNARIIYGWAAEAALVALTIVVALGLQRLFLDATFLRDVLALAIASHLVAITSRRAGLGMASSALLSAVAALVTITVLLYADTANMILPTSQTIDLVRTDLREGWTVFSDERAPVPVVPGFVLATGTLLWVTAFLADWAAFRLRSPVEAVAPATGVFVFTSLLGAGPNQVLHGALFAATATVTLLTIRVNRQARDEVWIESASGVGPGATLRLGVVAGSVAVLAGAAFGPLLPGAGEPGLVDVTELDNGPQTRVVISPLVQVQATIVDQSRFEVFSVAVPEGSHDYWRLMSLDEFDGALWSAHSNFDPADGPVDSDLDPSLPRRTVRQTFTTNGRLGNIYLPVAYELSAVIDSGAIDLEYETDSGTLVVTRESYADSLDGFTYTVESTVPVPDGPLLRASSTDTLGSGFRNRYTQLPNDFPESVRAEAQRVTADATNDFDRAVALQEHLRSTLDYNIDVALTQDVDDLESFLFEVKEGYCVQFASAFAAMARSIGLPTRLAVGFTWGEWDETRAEYVVRGEHAHAWPEVFFDGHGWINFEPTPGRGGPNDTTVTGHSPQQAGSDAEPPSTTVPVADATTGDAPFGPAFEDFADPVTASPGPTETAGSSFPYATIALVMLVIAAAGSLVPALRVWQRRRRMARAAADSRARVELAWDDALEALELLDVRHLPQETPAEFARRIEGQRSLGPIGDLADTTTSARYGPQLDDEQVRSAESSAEEIRSACRHWTTRRRRAAAWFDPRPLLKR